MHCKEEKGFGSRVESPLQQGEGKSHQLARFRKRPKGADWATMNSTPSYKRGTTI